VSLLATRGTDVKFFFPDTLDQVDPAFDFLAETHQPGRIRQRDDSYAHEMLGAPPYHGMLVSMSALKGTSRVGSRYTPGQRLRFEQGGVHEFLRLNRGDVGLEAMGDCGAFSYVAEDVPPYSCEEVLTFYADCGFDYGISVDHVISGFDPAGDESLFPDDVVAPKARERQQLTMHLAAEFIDLCQKLGPRFEPVGVAQGWSTASYAESVKALQAMGYSRLAIGGLVGMKSQHIDRCLTAIDEVRASTTELHLLGVTRLELMSSFAAKGVTSFDSTSPFLRAFKDDRDNYYWEHSAFSAFRVPQVDSNPSLRKLIASGAVDSSAAAALERQCLAALRAYDGGSGSAADALDALEEYAEVYQSVRNYRVQYEAFLNAAPWKRCPCKICRAAGIEVAIFRGSERNKRRGFHNLSVFHQSLI